MYQNWDLNTGQVIRTFQGHTSQISSITWRPLKPPSSTKTPDEEMEPPTRPLRPSSAISGSRPTSSAGARMLSGRESPTPSNKSFDPLFDEGSSSESPPNTPKSKTAFNVAASLLPNQTKTQNDTLLPEPSETDSDVFLTTSIDGQVSHVQNSPIQTNESKIVLFSRHLGPALG